MTRTLTEDHRTPVIMTDLTHTRKLVATLRFHHRAARSLNLIGMVLKDIAGTPVFNDWEKIKPIKTS
uniref:RE31004p n=1 Tax=Drosophila melanogaster TaxID=7227 RepID=Q8SY03_DROME|nr:RE31004p [Drosophila melanogaster]